MVTMAQGSLLTLVILQCHLENVYVWCLSSDLSRVLYFFTVEQKQKVMENQSILIRKQMNEIKPALPTN